MAAEISLFELFIGFIPVLLVLFLLWRSSQGVRKGISAIARMFIQLMLVGYLLLLIFDNPSPILTSSLLLIMTLVASWLSLNVGKQINLRLFSAALISILIGGGLVLLVVTQGVLDIEPWYNPRYLLPLAGMIFTSSMTAISLSLERFESELDSGMLIKDALDKAFNAAMIPVVNSMLAVGVVSLPGMMTGQILSGVEPVIAARYQIMVMCMIFSSTGLTVFSFVHFLSKQAELSQSQK